MNRNRLKTFQLMLTRFIKSADKWPHMAYVATRVLLRKPVIRQAVIAVTYDCPCNCEFCSSFRIAESIRNPLSTKEMQDTIDQFAKLGALSLCFTGGEPTVFKDIVELVSHVNRRRMLCSIITSCVSYSDKLWEDLHKAGITNFFISVDGIGTKHDEFRGVPGLFKKIEQAVTKCRELGIEFYFNGVVTNENISDGTIYEIIEYCQRNNIYFLILYTSATGKYSHSDYLLTEENRKEFDRIRNMKNVFWEGDGNLLGFGCPAGSEVVLVTAHGEVIPCPFIEVSFGNVIKDGLEKSIGKMRSYDLFRVNGPKCLMGADKSFYHDWLMPLTDQDLPMMIEKHPMHSAKNWLTKKDC